MRMRSIGLVIAVLFHRVSAASAQTKPAPKAAPARNAAPEPAGMTNADVIKMVKAGLGESLVISSIKQAAKRSFTLTADGMVERKTAGVSDNVIRIMLDPTASVGETPAALAAPSKPAAPEPPAARADAPLVAEIWRLLQEGCGMGRPLARVGELEDRRHAEVARDRRDGQR
jgi:hypothetical protein